MNSDNHCSNSSNVIDGKQDEVEHKNIQKVQKYESMDETKLMKFMNETIERINNVIPISPNIVRILLNYFKWDEEKLISAFYDGDQEQLFRDVNISNPFEENSVAWSCEEECLICFEKLPLSKMHSLGCKHIYCNDCWSKYLENRILDEGMGENITCAAHRCTILMDDETCLKLLNNDRAVRVYQKIITNGFVAKHPNLIWCSSPGCTYALKYRDVENVQPIICECGAYICFTCGSNWHMPLQCNMFRKWLKKCRDDSATQNWIAVNTKECPKCSTTIEKRGGCNHMICKYKACGYEFCWICMGIWYAHSYNCNRFSEHKIRAAQYAQESLRCDLERFLFHYNRYMDNQRSIELEKQLRSSVNDKIKILKQTGMPLSEMQLISDSVDVLRQCRTALMCTYAFAYYLRENGQYYIFSENQAALQKATESLSKYLESKIESNNYSNLTPTLINLRDYCDSRRKAAESHVVEGYEQNLWKFRDS